MMNSLKFLRMHMVEAHQTLRGIMDYLTNTTQSIRNSSTGKDVSSFHIILKKQSIPVAVSSIFIYKQFAGLYNVGTLHAKRRNNFGSLVSMLACKFAFDDGASIIFLQTQADSLVEDLYKKIGFKRKFIGSFLVI